MVVLNDTNNHVNLLTKSLLTGDAAMIKHRTGLSCFAFTNPVSFSAIYSEYSGGIFFNLRFEAGGFALHLKCST